MKAKNIEENRTKFTTSIDLRIRFNEIDALGIVWHGHYIKYFEDAREAFGKKLNQFQALQFRLADLETDMQAARIFLRQAAWKLDNNANDATKFCAMAKRFVTDVSFNVANECLQLHGGYGYLSDYGIEKIVRDLRVHQILEGTNEIMRMIISRVIIDENK